MQAVVKEAWPAANEVSDRKLFLQKYRGAAMEVITEFVNDPSISPADAAKRMGDAVEAQK